MRTHIIRSAIGLLFLAAACGNGGSSSSGADANSPAPSSTVSAPAQLPSPGKKGTLMFFMNPHGAPCQMQNSILNGVMSSISGTVDIRYVKTTNPADEELFYTYAIKGLPSMIIVDAENKVVKRFSPGIQSGDTIEQAVRGL